MPSAIEQKFEHVNKGGCCNVTIQYVVFVLDIFMRGGIPKGSWRRSLNKGIKEIGRNLTRAEVKAKVSNHSGWRGDIFYVGLMYLRRNFKLLASIHN